MEKILTIRPDRKPGSKIRSDVYHSLSEFILVSLDHRKDTTLTQLLEMAMLKFESQLPSGELGWFILQVKLDLEARGLIKQKLGYGKPRKISIVRIKKKVGV